MSYTAWSAYCNVNYRPHSLPRQRSIVTRELHSMVCFMQCELQAPPSSQTEVNCNTWTTQPGLPRVMWTTGPTLFPEVSGPCELHSVACFMQCELQAPLSSQTEVNCNTWTTQPGLLQAPLSPHRGLRAMSTPWRSLLHALWTTGPHSWMHKSDTFSRRFCPLCADYIDGTRRLNGLKKRRKQKANSSKNRKGNTQKMNS